MTDKVKAAVMVGPGQVELREYDKPELGRKDIWLKVDYAGICGTDKHYYLGHSKLAKPVVLGHEIVGTIAALGSEANDAMIVSSGPLKEGDRVAVAPSPAGCGRCWSCLNLPLHPNYCPNKGFPAYGFTPVDRPPHLWGGFAEYLYVQPDSFLFKIEDGMSTEVAALAEPATTAITGIAKIFRPGIPLQGEGFGPGSSVIVLGVGPIGLLAVAMAKYSGAATVFAVDLLDSRLQLARDMGADVLVNAGQTSLEERVQSVREQTEGMGCDVLIETAGVPAVFAEGLQYLRRGGVYLEIGHFTDPGGVEVHPHAICRGEFTIHGTFGYPPMMFKPALSFLRDTQAPVEELVTHTLKLEDIVQALKLAGTAGTCKVLIAP